MKRATRTLIFLIVLSFCLPQDSHAYSVSCDQSIKTELWPYATHRAEVIKLQSFLSRGGYHAPVTGFYGNMTIRALLAYQKDNGIFPSGALGSMTRLLINQSLCNAPVENFDAQEKTVITPIQGILLPIPLIEQSYRLSCEAASIEMALRHRGINRTQTFLMNAIGYAQPFAQQNLGGKIIWGDPDLGFVGDVKGFVWLPPQGLPNATGWGVNPPPVARVLKTFLPSTSMPEDANIEDIITALHAQKPVIFWHKRDEMVPDQITYTTPLGKSVDFTSNHVALIVGYEKDKDGKRFFWINDPTFGRLHIDEETLVRWWARQDNKLVIVG